MAFVLGLRSKERLRGVHPNLEAVVVRALALSAVDFAVTEGVRDLVRQRELYKAGKTLTLRSKHLPQADGWSHAVDVMAVGDLDGDGDVDAKDKMGTWDLAQYEKIAAAFAKAAWQLNIKIRWGGTFKRKDGTPFVDAPHFELVL